MSKVIRSPGGLDEIFQVPKGRQWEENCNENVCGEADRERYDVVHGESET